jgi:hypothetical protein
MNEFTASNGKKVTRREYGMGVNIGSNDWGALTGVTDDQAQALREFFRAEEDERLGRWRWPENPDYVVYPSDQFRGGNRNGWVIILHEPSGIAVEANRHARTIRPDMQFVEAGRAFFDAHPDPKPWDAAEDNEIWVLTGAGGLELPWRRTAEGEWESITPKAIRRRNNDLITAGRRIWPEVQS